MTKTPAKGPEESYPRGGRETAERHARDDKQRHDLDIGARAGIEPGYGQEREEQRVKRAVDHEMADGEAAHSKEPRYDWDGSQKKNETVTSGHSGQKEQSGGNNSSTP